MKYIKQAKLEKVDEGPPGVGVVTQESGVLIASELGGDGAWSESTELNLLPKSKFTSCELHLN